MQIANRPLPFFGTCVLAAIGAFFVYGCAPEVQTASGVRMATVGDMQVDSQGRTVEQSAVINKIKIESDPNKVWFLYVISPYNGTTILKSTVKGKVTSSGRRLTPSKTTEGSGMTFSIGNQTVYTNEIPNEDGTYGSYIEYIYWVDDQGANRRHFITGGQIVHLTDKKDERLEHLAGDR